MSKSFFSYLETKNNSDVEAHIIEAQSAKRQDGYQGSDPYGMTSRQPKRLQGYENQIGKKKKIQLNFNQN